MKPLAKDSTKLEPQSWNETINYSSIIAFNQSIKSNNMKTFTYCIALVMWALSMVHCYAQEENNNSSVEWLENSREVVIAKEKNELRKEVERINNRVDNNELDFTTAEQLKKEAAERRALNIENKLAIIDNKIELLKRNGEDNLTDTDKLEIRFLKGGDVFGFDYTPRERKYDVRTTSDLVFSFGLNNTIIKGQSIDDSPYKVGGSRYAEIGLAWKTRVFKESNWLRVKYGFSFQFNGLKPTDNRFFVDNGADTSLEVSEQDLDKSKFRMDNLVIPVHFEFGPSKKITKEDYFRYNTNSSFKVGVGGYAGINLGTRQKLKFNDGSEDVKQKQRGNFNTNNFIYGLSGYVGWGDVSLYAKYDLNTIFKDNPVEERNVSLGVRWDWD